MLKQFCLSMATVVILVLVASCSGDGNHDSRPVRSAQTNGDNINISVNPDVQASKNLDLTALAELVKKSKDATSIEAELNKPEGINNLDLNNDKQVDYINVTEYDNKDNGAKGFSFYTKLGTEESDVQDIATIEIEKGADQNVNVHVVGSQNIYGDNAHYIASYPSRDFLIAAWLFSNHPVYVSPWHYGYYPSFYNPYYRVPYSTYYDRTNNYRTQTSFRTTTTTRTIRSPYAGRSSARVTAPVARPTAQQRSSVQAVNRSMSDPRSAKSFQARSADKPIGSGGFGRNNNSYSQPSTNSQNTNRGGAFGRSTNTYSQPAATNQNNSSSTFGRSNSGYSQPSPSTTSTNRGGGSFGRSYSPSPSRSYTPSSTPSRSSSYSSPSRTSTPSRPSSFGGSRKR